MKIDFHLTVKVSKLLFRCSVAVFVLSMFFDSFYILSADRGNLNPSPFLPPPLLLFIGVLGLISGTYVSWAANPLIILSWVLLTYKRRIASFCTSSLALVLALPFLTAKSIPDGNGFSHLIAAYGIGYWLWIFSMLIAILASLSTFSLFRH